VRYVALFLLIQSISLVLTLIGIPVCAVLAYGSFAKYDSVSRLWHWPRWAWIWDNFEDGTAPRWYEVVHPDWSIERLEFHWTALRNPCNNLRFCPGVSKVGRPLWYRTWMMFGKQFYAKAGWERSGYPSLSAGGGRGF